MKSLWFVSGVAAGATLLSVSMASVPKSGRVTNDTAIYQNLSEIRVPRDATPDFDADIDRLARMESRYHERNLPTLSGQPRVSSPMQRISNQKYRYSGASTHAKKNRASSRQ